MAIPNIKVLLPRPSIIAKTPVGKDCDGHECCLPHQHDFVTIGEVKAGLENAVRILATRPPLSFFMCLYPL